MGKAQTKGDEWLAPGVRKAFVGTEDEQLRAWHFEQKQPCLVCVGHYGREWVEPFGYVRIEFFPAWEGWPRVADFIEAGTEVWVCDACWETCPYHGALSLVDGAGGELMVCDTGKLTEVMT